MFKRHKYPIAIILQAVQSWVFKFSPMIEATIQKRKKHGCDSWRMDQTYIKVRVINPIIPATIIILFIIYDDLIYGKILIGVPTAVFSYK